MSRSFHEVFLERVIHIEAVQCEFADVTDKNEQAFFIDGALVGDPELPDYRWSLDAPEPFARRGVQLIGEIRGGVGRAFPDKLLSKPFERAWNAAVEAWAAFLDDLRSGKLIAQTASGDRTAG